MHIQSLGSLCHFATYSTETDDTYRLLPELSAPKLLLLPTLVLHGAICRCYIPCKGEHQCQDHLSNRNGWSLWCVCDLDTLLLCGILVHVVKPYSCSNNQLEAVCAIDDLFGHLCRTSDNNAVEPFDLFLNWTICILVSDYYL